MPRDVLRRMGQAGLFGLMYESAYGGAEADAPAGNVTPLLLLLGARKLTVARVVDGKSVNAIEVSQLRRALGDDRNASQPQRCDACFTGAYPTHLTDQTKHHALDRINALMNGFTIEWGAVK